MEYDSKKLGKYNKFIIKVLLVVLSFVMGNILILFSLKYLSNITILNTFLIIVYIYFFQLFIEILKYLLLYTENKSLNKENYLHVRLFNFKFLIINFFMFILSSLIILGGLLFSLFFSNFKILFILLMAFAIAIAYFFYTVELLNIFKYNPERYNFRKLNINKQRDLYVLIMINLLFMIFLLILFYLFKYIYPIIFVVIVLIDLVLLNINRRYLEKDFNNC